MKNLKEELRHNFLNFQDKLKKSYKDSFEILEKHEEKYLDSYERIASLESWRAYLIEQEVDENSSNFFTEAQNDALLSHTLARIGSWRSALHALRSAIENVLFCLYYKDHPVEYRLWEKGKDRIPILDFISYLDRHPNYADFDGDVTGLSLLKKEYPTLSKAVHGSSSVFRMTDKTDSFPSLMIPELSKLNQWSTREKKAIQLINQLLLTMFADCLQGTKLRNLRKSVSFSVPDNLKNRIKAHLNIRLFTL